MRIQVQLSEQMVERIDKIAELYGVNRSAFCAMIIGQSVSSLEQASSIVQSAVEKGVKNATKEAK